MRAAFTKALYYPSIDIDNIEWLKSALLFWDEMQTIVPEQAKYTYHNRETQYLESVGFLSPIKVSSDDHIVKETSQKMIDYISAQSRQWNEDAKIWAKGTWFLHPDKMSDDLQKHLEDFRLSLSSDPRIIEEPWRLDREFSVIPQPSSKSHYARSTSCQLKLDNRI